MPTTLNQRVKEALEASSGLMALTQDGANKGIHFSYPAKGARVPCVSYYVLQTNSKYSFGLSRYERKTVSIDIWSKSSATNNAMEALITTALGSFMLKDIETDIPADSSDQSGIKHKNIKYYTHE